MVLQRRHCRRLRMGQGILGRQEQPARRPGGAGDAHRIGCQPTPDRKRTRSVDGTWDITIKTLIGERKATVILKSEDGATLRTKERLLYDGMVEGDTVRWKTDVTSPMALTLAFTG